ncbi:MAG: sensor histidine kinase [Deltaproteobacteria bacterium]|nr:sensor histidine kinase [Deltaproteobacteria bacterium]
MENPSARNVPTGTRPPRRGLFSPAMLLAAWVPAVVITVLHYLTGAEHHGFHDILRRLYYLPIILASFSCGLRGGLLVATLVTAAYSPHAFTHLGHMDPAAPLEKSLELLLYLVVGGVTGRLVDRERARQHELGEALKEQQRTAAELIRAGRLAALGEMVSAMAHEIKNPLHALRGTAEVVDAVVPKDAPQHRLWELHRQEIDRLESVAVRFLSFARPSPPERRSVDLAQVVERVRTLIAPQAQRDHVTIEVPERTADPAQTVAADEQQLVQVLLNISLNGLQAMEAAAGSLSFQLAREQRHRQAFAVIRIENTGPTIPEAKLERIFDPFFTTKESGSGLGLSIAARIVEQHGGLLEVENLPAGRGVRFSVLLPEGTSAGPTTPQPRV